MKLFLIRHAQSENNARPEHERVPDPPLTKLGRQQAERLGEWIPELKLTRLITSPFLRTLQTTRPIMRATGLVPEVRPDWFEHGGCYSGYLPGKMRGEPGMKRSEIEQMFPGFRVHDQIDETGWYRLPVRESIDQARQRAIRLLTEARAEFGNTQERVACVIHADLKRFLLEIFHDVYLDVPVNTSVTAIELTADRTRLLDFNRVDHLPEMWQTI